MTELEDRLGEAARWPVQPPVSRVADAASAAGLLDVAYSLEDSPFGPLLIAASPRGLVMVAYDPDERVLERLARRFSPRVLRAPARLEGPRRQLGEYFEGRRHSFELGVDWGVWGGFAQRVLKVTARVPFGEVSSYKAVAAAAGVPAASRAAGNALGANPVPIVVPCHRILRSDGTLGGYTGGLDRKRWLLALEGVEPVS